MGAYAEEHDYLEASEDECDDWYAPDAEFYEEVQEIEEGEVHASGVAVANHFWLFVYFWYFSFSKTQKIHVTTAVIY